MGPPTRDIEVQAQVVGLWGRRTRDRRETFGDEHAGEIETKCIVNLVETRKSSLSHEKGWLGPEVACERLRV